MCRGGLLFACSLLLAGCARQAPTWISIESRLLPEPQRSGSDIAAIETRGDGYSLDFGDCRLFVKAVSDRALNRQFVGVSYRGEDSANPYTFGNWIDPELGYTPPRFTVFWVEMSGGRDCLARLDDLRLTTDRGDTLTAYRYGSLGPHGLLDRLEQDWPGRGDLLREAEGILEQTYAWRSEGVLGLSRGYVVFDPLDYAVDRVSLVLSWQAGDSLAQAVLAFRQHLARHEEPLR